jgi:hypothetical protein
MAFLNIGSLEVKISLVKKIDIFKSKKNSSDDDVRAAIEKLQGKDRLGNVSQLLTTAGGAAAGASAAGAVAAAAGTTTLLGSTSLASALAGIAVVSTPIGWVAGCAIVGAAAAYGVSKLVRSGGRNDRVREEIIERLSKRLMDIDSDRTRLDAMQLLRQSLSDAIRNGKLVENQAIRLLDLIENGKLSISVALERINGL